MFNEDETDGQTDMTKLIVAFLNLRRLLKWSRLNRIKLLCDKELICCRFAEFRMNSALQFGLYIPFVGYGWSTVLEGNS